MTEPAPAPDTDTGQLTLGMAAYAEAAQALVARTRMEVCIFTHDLDPRAYAGPALVEQMKAFLLSHRRARLRVLLRVSVGAARGAHPLIELGRSLSSRVEFRQLPEDRLHSREEYLLSDEWGFIIKQDHDALEARYYPHAPLDARQLLRRFEPNWQASTPARELSELKL